jgi:hypothetical protein
VVFGKRKSRLKATLKTYEPRIFVRSDSPAPHPAGAGPNVGASRERNQSVFDASIGPGRSEIRDGGDPQRDDRTSRDRPPGSVLFSLPATGRFPICTGPIAAFCDCSGPSARRAG